MIALKEFTDALPGGFLAVFRGLRGPPPNAHTPRIRQIYIGTSLRETLRARRTATPEDELDTFAFHPCAKALPAFIFSLYKHPHLLFIDLLFVPRCSAYNRPLTAALSGVRQKAVSSSARCQPDPRPVALVGNH